MASDTEGFQDGESILLNGSALTVRRIDKLIEKVSEAYLKDDIVMYFKTLEDLWYHSREYFKKPEIESGNKKYLDLGKFVITHIPEEYCIEYDDALVPALKKFHQWLLSKLHTNKVTMGSKPGLMGGLQAQYQKYGL